MASLDVDAHSEGRPPEGKTPAVPPQAGQSHRLSTSSNGSTPPLTSATSSALASTAAAPSQGSNEQNVIVETETVPSVTTLGVNPHSTLRIKRSQDSVPRLNTTKVAGKRRSLRLAQGSKADIFAAKVANAVEEQDSSGDETFVYQAPITAAHATDTLRRPYMRSASNSSFHQPAQAVMYPQSDNYFSDDAGPTESESDFIPTLLHQNLVTGETDLGQISPTKVLQPKDKRSNIFSETSQGGHQLKSQDGLGQSSSGQTPILQGSRSFVVPKKARAASQLNNAQPPSHVLKSSMASFHYAHDAENIVGQEEFREAQWPRSSRVASRSKLFTIEPVSPMKDPNGSIRAKHSYLQRWKGSAPHSDSYADESTAEEPIDERTSLLLGRSSLLNYQTSRNSYGKRQQNNGSSFGQQRQAQRAPTSSFSNHVPDNEFPGYTSDPELSPNNRMFKELQNGASMSTRIMVGVSLFLSLLLSVIFVSGVFLAAARPLRDFGVVALSDVLVSDKELVFTMITRARNPGIFSRLIEEGELDIFATSSHTGSGPYSAPHESAKKFARTVLLGTITELGSPMLFRGGLSSPLQWRAASAKLVSPSANNSALWSEISAYEFELTIKGILSYNVLGGQHKETVSQTHHVASPDLTDSIHVML